MRHVSLRVCTATSLVAYQVFIGALAWGFAPHALWQEPRLLLVRGPPEPTKSPYQADEGCRASGYHRFWGLFSEIVGDDLSVPVAHRAAGHGSCLAMDCRTSNFRRGWKRAFEIRSFVQIADHSPKRKAAPLAAADRRSS